MENSPAVVVEDLWESFRIYHERVLTLKDRLVGRRRTRAEEFWALQGVNLEVASGETVALVGPNGSGKTTLLKCIARILSPTRGTVSVRGKTAALLELGAGFHGDLTGRENVFLNASILGFGRKEVDSIFEDVVAFSELQEFIDTPVRNYSSGMYVRLGFSVAVHLDPDVLLVDEVLAVGDARFQARCFERIRHLQRAGTTIVLVTHDLDAAASVCERAYLLEGGKIVEEGSSHVVVDHYRQRAAAEATTGRFEGGEVRGSGDMTISDIKLETASGGPMIASGERFSVTFEARANKPVERPVFGLIVRSTDGAYLFDTNTLWRHQDTGSFAPDQSVRVRFDLTAHLLSGVYLVTVAAANTDGRKAYDWHTDVLAFEVSGPTHSHGVADLKAEIDVAAHRKGLTEPVIEKRG